MATQRQFSDAVLGTFTRNERLDSWNFSVLLSPSREVQGQLLYMSAESTLPADWLQEVREFMAWLKPNETSLRARMAELMFEEWQSGWYDPEIDSGRTRLGFQRQFRLYAVNFYEAEPTADEPRTAELYYHDGNLFGGHSITLTLKLNGEIRFSPNIVG